jgi:hypothetical protein
MTVELGQFSLDRMVRAVEKVRGRLLRAANALGEAGVPYAVAGGNAVALWVSRVDESAVRNTRDVDILTRRSDLGTTYDALAKADLNLSADPDAQARDAVHVAFADEKVRTHEELPNPDVSESEDAGPFRVLALEALVRVKLTAFRDKDRTHLRDLIDVGLIDATWPGRYPVVLGDRLRQLIETLEG